MHEKQKENKRTPSGTYRFDAFVLNPSERQLYREGTPLALPPKAFDALLHLVQHPGRLVRRDELVAALWPETFVTDANLTNLIVSLRKVVGRSAIETVSKFGYRFTLPVLGEPNVDDETYGAFVRAQRLVLQRSVESVTEARDLLLLCVTNDPGFAPAWAWLGRCYRFLEKFDVEPALNLELAQAALRRAFAIDPDLACAHQFYTQLQADLGHARDAMVRLAERVQRSPDTESYAGLVQVLRFCGLLDESIAAHHEARRLDPAVMTGVSHTYFLKACYEEAIEHYVGAGHYLDAAALTALGERSRARALLAKRLADTTRSQAMTAAMASLLAILEDRRDEALAMIRSVTPAQEPELMFYLARHAALCGAESDTMQWLERSIARGFTCPYAMEHDAAFATLRASPAFQQLRTRARVEEQTARAAFERAGARASASAADPQI